MRTKILSILVLLSLVVGGCSTLQSPAVAEDTTAPAPTTVPEMAEPAQSAEINAGVMTGLDGIQQGLREIYEVVAPSVVHVRVEKTETVSSMGFDFEIPEGFPFDFSTPFGDEQGQQQERKVSGQGSGFVWDTEGNIVTNNHVVSGADKITVTFSDGSSVPAEIVGTDVDSDLAVIKVQRDAAELQPVTLADSTNVLVGDMAIAVGNPYGLQGTMTVGIISALGRSLPVEAADISGGQYTIPDVIQTDAPINPGNSGGVLTDIQGRVVGVTSAIQSNTGSNAGIGYVVPSIIVQNVVPELIANGSYQHTFIGISGLTLTSELASAMDLPQSQRGVLVSTVRPGSPAEKTGLQGSDVTAEVDGAQALIGGDVITAIDQQPVNDFEDLVAYLARYTTVGDEITLDLIRNGEESSVSLTLAARPSTEEDMLTMAGSQATLGIEGLDLDEQIAEAAGLDISQTGVLVQRVQRGSAADEAGLRGSFKTVEIDGQEVLVGGDVIVALGDESIESLADLQGLIAQYHTGDNIKLTVLRDGQELVLDVEW